MHINYLHKPGYVVIINLYFGYWLININLFNSHFIFETVAHV